MATSGKIAKAVSYLTGTPLGTVKFYQAALRHGGLIAVGGRGRSARAMTIEDAISLLVATITATSAEDVPDALKRSILARGQDPFVFEARYRNSTDQSAKERLTALVEDGDRIDAQHRPHSRVKLDFFDTKQVIGRHLGAISASTENVFRFLCDVTAGCVENHIFEHGCGRALRYDTFLDYDSKAQSFTLDIWLDNAGTDIIFPFPDQFSLGIEFCAIDGWSVESHFRDIRRLNLDSCGYLAAVVANVLIPEEPK